jgi:hypothetical protein
MSNGTMMAKAGASKLCRHVGRLELLGCSIMIVLQTLKYFIVNYSFLTHMKNHPPPCLLAHSVLMTPLTIALMQSINSMTSYIHV